MAIDCETQTTDFYIHLIFFVFFYLITNLLKTLVNRSGHSG